MVILAPNADFTNPRKLRSIIMVAGDKGGTGKSFGGRAAAAWLIANGYKAAAVDAGPATTANSRKMDDARDSHVVANHPIDLL